MIGVLMDPLDDELARSRRERWWRSNFIILATVYVALLVTGLLLQIFGAFTQIVLTVFLAWLLAFVLSPVVGWLQHRFRFSRALAVGTVYLVTLLASAFLLFYAASSIGANVAEMADDLPLTRARIEGTLRSWEEAITFGRFEPDLIAIYRDLEASAAQVGSSVIGRVPEVTAAVLGGLALVIILSLYMVGDSAAIIAKVRRIVPTRYADEFDILDRSVSRAFGGFLRAQVILAAIQTLLTILVVWLVDLPYGFLIVATSAFAMLIPFFGPPLALIPPILATAIFAPEWIILVAPGLLAGQTVLVNYFQPRLMQDALGMHPLLVLIGLLVGAQVAGVWGALFCIPVIAVLNVFFNYAVNLRTIEERAEEPIEEVLEEVRQEAPDATPEELVAIAADRVEEAVEEADAAEQPATAAGAVSDDLREAATDLREAASEQLAAAGEIGESAAGLHDAVDRMGDDQTEPA
jgi:predicted PurR-regulated permease PerM